MTDIVEELFEGEGLNEQDTEGTNRTETYVAKIRLSYDIPELLPVAGRRIRISYRGVQVLCTKCFSKHYKSRFTKANKLSSITILTPNPQKDPCLV